MKRTVLIGELAIRRWHPIAGVIAIIRRNCLMTSTQISGFQPRKNSYIDIIVPCIIPPTGYCSMMIQPVTTYHKSLVTLHVGSRKIHQSCRAIIYLSRCPLYYPQKQTGKTTSSYFHIPHSSNLFFNRYRFHFFFSSCFIIININFTSIKRK